MKKVSIILPVKPGGRVTALAALKALDFPPEAYEVLVAEGTWPSRQRNEAAAYASGELLYFLDDDSLVSPGFLQRMLRHYDDPAVAAVGGPSLTPPTDTMLQQTFGLVLSSRFGGGAVRTRYCSQGVARATKDNELILCNLSFRRDVFLQCGGLDERLYPNEENELLARLYAQGWRLIHDPELAVYRSQRPTLRAFIRQIYGYGRGRGEQTIISRTIPLPSLVPPLFFLYCLSLPLINNPVYYLPLLCYLLGDVCAALGRAFGASRLLRIPLLALLFPLLHLSYGAGMIWGVAGYSWKKVRSCSCSVVLRRIKEFTVAEGANPGKIDTTPQR